MIRQMLRGVETISAITEFGPITNFFDMTMLTSTSWRTTEEEILNHLKTLDYDNADVAKAYTLLPCN